MRRHDTNGGGRRSPPLRPNFQFNSYPNFDPSNTDNQPYLNPLQFTGDPFLDLVQPSNFAPRLDVSTGLLRTDYVDFGSYHHSGLPQNYLSFHGGYSGAFNGTDMYNSQASSSRPPVSADPWNAAHPTAPSDSHPILLSNPNAFDHLAPWMRQAVIQSFDDSRVHNHPPPTGVQPATVETYSRTTYPTPLPTPEASVNNLTSSQQFSFDMLSNQFGQAQDLLSPAAFDMPPNGFEDPFQWASVNGRFMDSYCSSAMTHAAPSISGSSSDIPSTSIDTAPLLEWPVVQTTQSNYYPPSISGSDGDHPVPSQPPPPERSRHVHETSSAIGPQRRTKASRAKSRVDKPYREKLKAKAKTKDPTSTKANDSRLDACSVPVPPSPEITVKSISKKREKGKVAKMAHIRGGFGPTESQIVVTGPVGASHVPFKSAKTIFPQDGDWYRCRWNGCRYKVRATLEHLRAHMRNTHNIESGGRLSCQWRPPLRVQLPGRPEPTFVTNHQHSYLCGTELNAISVPNHVGSHLWHECQPNPSAKNCSCGHTSEKAFVRRGGHHCVEQGQEDSPETNNSEDSEEKSKPPKKRGRPRKKKD